LEESDGKYLSYHEACSLRILPAYLTPRDILNCIETKPIGVKIRRADKPNLHFELRIYGRSNLEWFAENVGAHCRLTRKKKFLNDKFLPRGNSNSA
jgi:hypothetical protein